MHKDVIDGEEQKRLNREASKARKKERKEDASNRLKAIQELVPAMKLFNAGMNQGPSKKKVSKIAPNEKLIINAVENNRKRH